MKKLAFIALLIPVLSFGQMVEISEMAGYSRVLSKGTLLSGYNDQLVLNTYNRSGHLSIGLLFGLNGWYPSNYVYGLLADVHFKKLGYFGISSSPLISNPRDYSVLSNVPFKKNVQIIFWGLHYGLNQKLSKHFILKEQLGYSYSSLVSYHDIQSEKLNYISALVGISYCDF